jgi:hypothetical protein
VKINGPIVGMDNNQVLMCFLASPSNQPKPYLGGGKNSLKMTNHFPKMRNLRQIPKSLYLLILQYVAGRKS